MLPFARPARDRPTACFDRGDHSIRGAPKIADAVALTAAGDAVRSPGSPLDATSRTRVDVRLGFDFSRVRIHDDAAAFNSAGMARARAYTVDSHIAFGRGEYQPHSPGGQRPLFHELVHAAQQGHAADPAPVPRPMTQPQDPREQQAATLTSRNLGSPPPTLVNKRDTVMDRYPKVEEQQRRESVALELLKRALPERAPRKPLTPPTRLGGAPGSNRFDRALLEWSERRAGRPLDEHAHDDVRRTLASPGAALDPEIAEEMGRRFASNFSHVRVHTDAGANASARGLGALAYAAGHHIVFACPPDARAETPKARHLLAHELSHVEQQRGRTTQPFELVVDPAAEAAADVAADAVMRLGHAVVRPGTACGGVLPNLEEKSLRFGVKWLSKRTVKTISKHVAKHAIEIAGKAIHSVFKSPKKIKSLVELAVKEAVELAAKHPRAAGEVLEEGGIKITRQASSTPGKFRILVQKVFDKEIGTKGEKVLRVVLDLSGRVVTAFPADRLAVIGLGVGAMAVLTERTASAAEQVRSEAEASAGAPEEPAFEWEDFIPFVGDIWGGSLNAGEDEILGREASLRAMIKDIIDEVEFTEKRSLDAPERAELEQIVRVGIALPMLIEGGDLEDADKGAGGDAANP
jgi:hypothetical protein